MKTRVWTADMPPFPREGIFHLEPAHDCPVTRMMVSEADRLRRINQLEAPETLAELRTFQKKLRRKMQEKTGCTYDGTLPVDIKVYGKLKEEYTETKLLLQVHDELILMTPLHQKDTIKNVLIECMEEAYKLQVKLVAEVNEGFNWFDLK